MSINSVKELIPGLLKEVGVNSKNLAIVSIVEQKLSGAKVVGMKNNVIYIEMESSVHLQEMTFRKRELLKSIQDAFPTDFSECLPEIRFFLKGTAHPPAHEKISAYRYRKAWKFSKN